MNRSVSIGPFRLLHNPTVVFIGGYFVLMGSLLTDVEVSMSSTLNALNSFSLYPVILLNSTGHSGVSYVNTCTGIIASYRCGFLTIVWHHSLSLHCFCIKVFFTVVVPDDIISTQHGLSLMSFTLALCLE